MRYLKKQTDSPLVTLRLSYDRASDRRQIRELLLEEQHRYCAYSERYIHHTDSCDIEHFDPRLKSTSDDNYWNWYAVLSWMNSHKPKKIDPYLPLPDPYDPSLATRIRFHSGVFEAVNDSDVEAQNLIKYLRWNHESLVRDRVSHLANLRFIRGMFANDEEFVEFIRENPDNLSFISAIEVEFDVSFP
jgi:hypothetical protein